MENADLQLFAAGERMGIRGRGEDQLNIIQLFKILLILFFQKMHIT